MRKTKFESVTAPAHTWLQKAIDEMLVDNFRNLRPSVQAGMIRDLKNQLTVRLRDDIPPKALRKIVRGLLALMDRDMVGMRKVPAYIVEFLYERAPEALDAWLDTHADEGWTSCAHCVPPHIVRLPEGYGQRFDLLGLLGAAGFELGLMVVGDPMGGLGEPFGSILGPTEDLEGLGEPRGLIGEATEDPDEEIDSPGDAGDGLDEIRDVSDVATGGVVLVSEAEVEVPSDGEGSPSVGAPSTEMEPVAAA